MNKYSSKAIKTAATVGMSLAMVLSNVAPVMAAYNSVDTSTSTKAENFMGDLLAVLTSKETLKPGDVVEVFGNKAGETAFFSYDTNEFKLDAEMKTALEGAVENTPRNSDDREAAKYLVELPDALNAMINHMNSDSSLVDKAKTLLKNPSYYNEDDGLSPEGYSKAIDLVKDFNDYEKYEGNLPEARLSGKYFSSEEYMDIKNELLDAFDNFTAANYGETLDKYLTDLEKIYNKFVDVQGKKGITKASVDTIVKGIKNGTYSSNAGYENVIYANLTKVNYDAFKEDDAVIELMEQFTDGYDNLEDVKEALSSKNEYTTALTKDKAKYADSTSKVTLSDWLNSKTFSEIKEYMTDEMFAIIKDYKENVIDVVLTLDSKQVGNTYVEKSEKTAYATNKQVADLIDNLDDITEGGTIAKADIEANKFGIFAISDKKEGTRYYDELVAHMEDVAKALEAVTTDIAKLTPANIKASDKALLEAAEDAIYELVDGDYADNLTSAQKRIVRQADTKITNLREAFDNLGTTNAAGWYDMGNGNWGYNNEDGTPAAYKWVASGADWYMIKDGKMLRNTWIATDGGRWYYVDNAGKMVTNQSVDGCWINSYGVYMSPSYNG